MNAIASFRKCTLSNKDLLEKVDVMTDGLFDGRYKSRREQILTLHIPAQPDNDYDLLIGELILRFAEMEKALIEVVKGYEQDGLKQMGQRDKVFYDVCKKAISNNLEN